VTPGEPRPPYRGKEEDLTRDERSDLPAPKSSADSSTANGAGRESAKRQSAPSYPAPDDESAATGIGRSVRNDVQWIKMDLDSRPAGEIMIRYEYRASLVRLGIYRATIRGRRCLIGCYAVRVFRAGLDRGGCGGSRGGEVEERRRGEEYSPCRRASPSPCLGLIVALDLRRRVGDRRDNTPSL
jgi:hypothetical protein